jgi:hypothetical protein
LRIIDGALGGEGEAAEEGDATVDVLVRGEAVRRLGAYRPRAAGARLFYVEEEAAARGLGADCLGPGEPIARDAVPRLLGGYDQVWHY